jgi:hypothetical protein
MFGEDEDEFELTADDCIADVVDDEVLVPVFADKGKQKKQAKAQLPSMIMQLLQPIQANTDTMDVDSLPPTSLGLPFSRASRLASPAIIPPDFQRENTGESANANGDVRRAVHEAATAAGLVPNVQPRYGCAGGSAQPDVSTMRYHVTSKIQAGAAVSLGALNSVLLQVYSAF